MGIFARPILKFSSRIAQRFCEKIEKLVEQKPQNVRHHFFCQGTKFRAERTSVSEISVAMQQDALLSFWPTYTAVSLLDSVGDERMLSALSIHTSALKIEFKVLKASSGLVELCLRFFVLF